MGRRSSPSSKILIMDDDGEGVQIEQLVGLVHSLLEVIH
jgi:hypothetical protein